MYESAAEGEHTVPTAAISAPETDSDMETMDAVVAVAIAVLAAVFVGSLVTLILVCRHRYCQKKDLISKQMADMRPDVHLISGQDQIAELELDAVRLHSDIEKILDDGQWVDDATGLIPHCLDILKICHHVTERLVAMAMRPLTQQRLCEIIEVAKRISPRVDDVVRSMYPPLDPRLLEARSTALVLSVTHLALVTRSVCGTEQTRWINQTLSDLDEHVRVLREAAVAHDSTFSMPNGTLLSSQPSAEL